MARRPASRVHCYHWTVSHAMFFSVLFFTRNVIGFMASNNSDAATCTFDIVGKVGIEDSSRAVAQGFVNCTGDNPVQLYIGQSSITPLIDNVSFHGVTIVKGDAMPAASAWLTFRNAAVTFENSTLYQISTDLDAVLGLYNSTVSIINSRFAHNTAKTSGGVIAQRMLGISIDNCTFEDNKGSLAGAVFVEDSNGIVVHSSVFEKNTANQGGGLTIKDSIGACDSIGGCNCSLINSSFVGNQVKEFGGGVYIAATQLNIAVESCSFDNNVVHAPAVNAEDGRGWPGGGGLLLNNTAPNSTDLVSLSMFNSTFHYNFAYGDGGGVHIDGADVVQIVHSTFLRNSGRLGGAAFVRAGNTSIVGGFFGRNRGGAVACQDCPAVKLVATRMDHNDAVLHGGNGGALKVYGKASDHVILDSVRMTRNRAQSGGAVSVEHTDEYGGTFMSIVNSEFRANKADQIPILEVIITSERDYLHYIRDIPSGTTFATLPGSGGALHLLVAVLWVDGSSFHSNFASNVGGAIFFMHSCIQGVETQQYAFDLPTAKANATQGHNCSSLVMSDTIMESNLAKAGGGIYTTSTQGFHIFCAGEVSQTQQIAQLSNGNNAGVAVPVPCQAWQDGDNFASIYGSVVAYPAAYMVIKCNGTGHQSQFDDLPVCRDAHTDIEPYAAQLDNFWSTSAVDGNQKPFSSIPLGVQLRDAMNQTVSLDFPSGKHPTFRLEAVGEPQGHLQGLLEATVQGADKTANTALFAEAQIKAHPGPMQFNVSCLDNADIPKSTVRVNVRKCFTGEVQGDDGDVCDRCPPDEFSFETTNATCDEPCPVHAQCPGRSNLYPENGYWHSNASAVVVHKCPNPDACQGSRANLETCQSAWYNASNKPGAQANLSCSLWDAPLTAGVASYRDEQCTPGYRGFLCAVCSQGYGVSGRFECEKCPEHHAAVLRYCLLICGIVAINAVLIWQLGAASSTGSSWNDPEAADYVDALLAYMQLVSMLVILDIDWPPALDPMFRFASAMVQLTPQLVSLDCILRHHQSSLPLPVSRALVQICLPFAILAFFCAVWLMIFPLLRWRWPSGKYSVAWLVRQFQVTSYSVLGYFYPSLTQAALSIFSCYPIDHPVPPTTPYPSFLKATWEYGYWISDMDIECFKGWHTAVTLGLALPSLLCFTLGIPAIFASLVCKRRQMLDTASCKEEIGYMYRAYRQGHWWEQSAFQLKMFALLLVVINGRPKGNYVQMLVLLCLLILEFAYQVYQHPYRFAHVQLVREVLVLLLSFSVIAGLFFENYQQQASKQGLALVAIGVAVVNMAFVVYMLYYICQLYLKEVKSIRILMTLCRHVRRSTREKMDSVLQLTPTELLGPRQAQQ